MLIACPKCQARHDVAGRAPGATLNCPCGNVLAVPKKAGPGWIIVLVIAAACAVPCIGILAAIAIPNFIKYQLRSRAVEARMNVRAIATAEQAWFMEHDSYLPAGPVPASVPGATATPITLDRGFTDLGWDPGGPVRYQYEVKVFEKKAVVIARGDLDGDGKPSEYRIDVTPEGPGAIKEVYPGEL